jgi:two-component system, cell cycle response regulator DivK
MEVENLKGKKILIVEDDFSSKLYLNKILEKTGAVLFNAADGNEALDMVRKNNDIELILMDIQLPLLDGYSCTKILRETGNKMVIIAQTAYGLSGDQERMKAIGFDDYLIKPISQKQLIDKISSYLLKH